MKKQIKTGILLMIISMLLCVTCMAEESTVSSAVAQGSTEAQNELGKCYYNGTGVEQNYEEALKYFQMAADQGYAKSQNNLDAGYEPDETDKEHMKEVLGEDYSTRDETKDNEAA